MMEAFAFAAACILAALQPAANAYPASVDRLPERASSRIDAIGRAAVRVEHVPGLTIGIVRNGAVVYAKGFGYRDLNSSTPTDGATRYEVGSNTKQFVAAAILMLRDQGKLSLDDRISKWFPDFPEADRVTVSELLSHTSGIADFTQSPELKRSAYLPGSVDRILAIARTMPPSFAPGTNWEYSNTGYVMLARIVEDVSGEDLGRFLEQRVFRPLGMDRTGLYDFDDATSRDVAIGYTSFALGEYHRIPVYDANWMFGAGDLSSNIYDLAKWNNALDNGKLLSAESTRLMRTPVILPGNKNTGYGFGLFAGRLPNGHAYIKHGGAIPGFITEDARFPDDHLQIIVLTDSDQFVMGPMLNLLYATFVPLPSTKTATPSTPAAADPPRSNVDTLAQAWLLGAIAGRPDRSILRPDFDQTLDPSKVRDLQALSRFGAFISMTRTGAEIRKPNTSYYYRVAMSKKTLIYMFTIGDDGKVSNIIVTNGDPIMAPARTVSGTSRIGGAVVA